MTPPELAPHHREMLEQESGLSPEVIAARGYRTVTAEEARGFGFRGQQARAGLLLPVHTTDGQTGPYVLRPDSPRLVEANGRKHEPVPGERPQRVVKYEWPRGVGPRLDCPPLCLARLKAADTPLWITEGQKKGDALASWGLCAIDLPNGVWGWRSKKEGLLADLDLIVWAERQVYLLFDSDVVTKPPVAQALARLATLLSRRGAKVSPVPLPQQGEAKLGVDDFKAQGGTLEQLLSFAALGRLLPLQTEAKRRPSSDSAELMAALEKLGFRFRMRGLDDLIEVNGRPLTDPLRAEIRTRMRDLGYKNLSAVEDAYTAWAYRHRYDPVRDYLRGLTWDGREHIARLAGYFRDDHATDYRIVTGDSDYSGHRVFYLWLRRWLIGTAGKALESRQSTLLCLDSHQAAGKSFFVRWLGSVLPDYFSEAPLLPDDKDSLIRLTNTFVWELGEISHLTKRWDKNALKHLISTRVVTVRKPYHRFDTIKPALAGLIGTLNNEAGFLTDPTGNRRFLVCRLKAIDWAYAEAIDPHQIWAEAVALYRAGEATLPTAEETRLQTAINQEYLVRSARRSVPQTPAQLRLDLSPAGHSTNDNSKG